MTDMSAPITAPAAGRTLLRWLPWAALLLAIAALIMLGLGPLGWRAGWWHYRLGLQTLMPDAAYVGLAAMAVALLALILAATRTIARRTAVFALIALLLGGVAAYFPWHWSNQRGVYVTLNDVTTDIDNPPSLAFAEQMRTAEHGNPVAYGGEKLAEVQKKAYPDIAPATLSVPPAQAFERALAVAKAKGWTILKTDPGDGIIDADEQSRWFGFTDDIAIRVTAAGGGSRVDIRSGARQGRGDFGVNANRVRGFLAALKAAG